MRVAAHTTSTTLRVAILDDHPPVIDGYIYRLGQAPNIEVVGTANSGVELEAILVAQPVDVVILDVQVPTAPDNPNPYPIFHIIPKYLERHPELAVLIISMTKQRTMVEAVMEAGASGYILKDDSESYAALGSIVRSIAGGEIRVSRAIEQMLAQRPAPAGEPLLTRRQIEALSVAAAYPEWSGHELAAKLHIQYSTLRTTLSHAYLRLGVHGLMAAIVTARQLGLLAPLPFADGDIPSPELSP